MADTWSLSDAIDYHARKSKEGKVTIVFEQQKTGTPEEIKKFIRENPNLKWKKILPA